MAAPVQPSQFIPTSPIVEEERSERCLCTEVALTILRGLGMTLIVASACSFAAGLLVPGIAALVAGIAMTLIVYTQEETYDKTGGNLSPECRALIRAIPAVEVDPGSLELWMTGATTGLFVGCELSGGEDFLKTGVKAQACAVIRAIKEHKNHPELPLEKHFAKQLDEEEDIDTPGDENFLANPIQVAFDTWKASYLSGEGDLSYDAVVRSSVIGAIYYNDLEAVVEKAILIAKVTDPDPRSVSSAVTLSVATALLVQGRKEVIRYSVAIGRQIFDEECSKLPFFVEKEEFLTPNGHSSGQLGSDHPYSCLALAFSILEGAEEPRQGDEEAGMDQFVRFSDVLDRVPQYFTDMPGYNAAGGALVGAYLGEVSIREDFEALDREDKDAINENSFHVAVLSGAFPNAAPPATRR